MADHWRQFGPPVYVAAAAYLGLIKPNKKKKKQQEKTGDLEELHRNFNGMGLNG
jgi:hypothetical protein